MVSTNAVLLAALLTAVEKKRDPAHFKRSLCGRSKHGVLTPPTEISAFTLPFLAAETNSARSSSPPEIDSLSTEGVVSLDSRGGSTQKIR